MMKIETSVTGQGLPKVAWIQSNSESGETRWTQRYRRSQLAGLLIGAAIGFASRDPLMWLAMPVIGIGIGTWWGSQGKPEPGTKLGANVVVDQYCEAFLAAKDGELVFCWSQKGQRINDNFVLPYADVSELALGSFNEWYGDGSEGQKFAESNVIVMPAENGQVYRLADHAGPKREIVQLHTVLTEKFISQRGPLLRAFEAAKRQAVRGPATSDVPSTI